MRIAGHTMGTPEYTLEEAIDFFSSLGMDGIEIIIETDGYKSGLYLHADDKYISELRELLKRKKLAVACLTPYLNLFNSTDESIRRKECDDLKKTIEIANRFDAKYIRVYGGKLLDGERDLDGNKLKQLVKSMRECGEYASKNGVNLCLENHFGTMTTTAKRTMEIVEEINHKNVGILYDQANIAFFLAEEYKEAVSIQKQKIYYVHCKDLVYKDEIPQSPIFSEVTHVKENERTVYSRIPGEGILDWEGILRELKSINYDGWISLEYERRWQQIDLPPASKGIPKGYTYIKNILKQLEA